MLSDEQKEQLATEIVPLFQELEQDVIKDIARRVHKTDRWTETAELQVKALEKLGYSPAKIQAEVWKTLRADPEYKKIVAENTLEYKHEITKKINDIVKQAQAAGDDIIGRAGNMDFADDVDIWAAQGRHLKKSPALEQIGETMAKRLRGDLKTLSHSTGFRTMGVPVKVTQAYNHALDRAITNVASGAFSPSQAVEMAVDEMEKSGLRKIDFASGVTRNLDVAAMLAVRTTISQMAGEISLANAESLGTDLVEVSSHPGARTGEGHGNHAAWQGKVYSISGRPHPEESKRLGYTIEKLSDATGYPDDPVGLKGYNCRHDFYPFIEGASEPNPMAKEPDPVTIDGKTYTYYQATQKQRAIERELRELKRRYIGGRQELAGAIKAKEQQYARFCEKAGVKQNLNRLYVKGYKRDFQYIEVKSGLGEMLEKQGLQRVSCGIWNKVPSETEIIKHVAQTDRTGGSCSSAALAYIGNKAGLYVKDFRGGESRKIFAKRKTIKQISNLDNVESHIVKGYNDVDNVMVALQKADDEKEYYLGAGQHAAIIRRDVKRGWQYLELQDGNNPGYKKLNITALKNRFACDVSHDAEAILIDTESLKRNAEFLDLLEFINSK